MAIKFTDKNVGAPAKKEVNGKTYVAEEPAPSDRDVENSPAGAEKKPRKGKR